MTKREFWAGVPSLIKTNGTGKLVDALVVLGFVFLSLTYTLGRIGDSFLRMSTLSGDAANIASFTAALDHPEMFTNDPLLSNPDNFAFYFTAHIPLIRALNAVFGGYGTAFASLLFPILFIQLMGFYYLGNTLYRNRFWAFLLAITTAIPVALPMGEFWGFYQDPLPRIVFQALLPFLLGVAIKRGGQPESWPWIMGGVGALVYVHPVSTPAWGGAILLGLWFSAPTVDIKRKFKMALIAGFVFLTAIAPFAANYLTTISHTQVKNYNQILKIMSYRFAPGYLDLPLALKLFYQQTIELSWINKAIWIWAGLGFGLITYLKRKNLDQDRTPHIIASWWGGLLLISVIIPLAEHEILSFLRRTPLEVDLIRGLRYIVPLLWMVSFWVLSEVYNALQQQILITRQTSVRLAALIVAIIGIGMTVAWANQNQFSANTKIPSVYACWTQGKIVCAHPQDSERSDFLDAIHVLTPQGSSIFFPDLAVRYYALRPITFIFKDGAALGYANHDSLLRWYKQSRELDVIAGKSQTKSLALDAYAEFARKYNADYFVLLYDNDYLAFRNNDFGYLTYVEEEKIMSQKTLSGLKLIYRNLYGSLYEIIK